MIHALDLFSRPFAFLPSAVSLYCFCVSECVNCGRDRNRSSHSDSHSDRSRDGEAGMGTGTGTGASPSETEHGAGHLDTASTTQGARKGACNYHHQEVKGNYHCDNHNPSEPLVRKEWKGHIPFHTRPFQRRESGVSTVFSRGSTVISACRYCPKLSGVKIRVVRIQGTRDTD